MPETARNPSFEADVRSSFQRQKFMALIGAEIVSIRAGEVEIAVPDREELHQQAGVAHAGVIAAIADSACGYAALTLMPPDSDVVSVEFKLNLLAPAMGGQLLARANVVRSGGTITVCQADVFADGTLVATMVGTMMRRHARRTENMHG
jgi:uncharacterized protein (TIGR00369 family)